MQRHVRNLKTRRARAAHRRSVIGAAVGAAALLAVTVIAFFGLPSSGSHELRGVFTTANQLRIGSEVRQAGVRIGEVSDIARAPDEMSLVTLRLDDSAPDVHADAKLAIEPRLLLEGNAAIDLDPGSRAAPELPSGATIPETQTSVPVQLDQVVNAFDLPTRGALHRMTAELAEGLGSRSGRGAAGFRRAARALGRSLDDMAHVATALRGTKTGDLGRSIRSFADLASEVGEDPRALAELETNTARVTAALVAGDGALGDGVRRLNATLGVAPGALHELDRALPSVTRLSGDLRRALRVAPDPLRRTGRLIASISALVRPRELPALLDRLAPVLDRAPGVQARLTELLPEVDRINRCLSRNVAPALNSVIPDGANTTGDPAWLDLMHAAASLAGASPGYDGNGTAIRLGVSQGTQAINGVLPGVGRVVGGGPKIEGVRPTWLGYGVEPPYRPDAPCTEQPVVDFSKRSDGGPPSWAKQLTTRRPGR